MQMGYQVFFLEFFFFLKTLCRCLHRPEIAALGDSKALFKTEKKKYCRLNSFVLLTIRLVVCVFKLEETAPSIHTV